MDEVVSFPLCECIYVSIYECVKVRLSISAYFCLSLYRGRMYFTGAYTSLNIFATTRRHCVCLLMYARQQFFVSVENCNNFSRFIHQIEATQ